MNSRLIRIAACIVLTHSLAGALGAQNPKPTAKSIPLHQSMPGYRELLSGPPESVHMRSGLVVLAPGKSVGKHSTEDHEEIVIVLEGRGQMMLGDGTRLDIARIRRHTRRPARNTMSSTPAAACRGMSTSFSTPRRSRANREEPCNE